MGKKIFKALALTGAAVGTAAAVLTIKHKADSKTILESIKTTMSQHGEIVSAWTDSKYQKVTVDGENKWVIVGGINIMEDFEIIEYHFLADAFTGELLDIKKAE